MKNTILGSLLVSALVLGTFGGVVSAGTNTGKTTGDVQFEKGNAGEVKPVDPTDPTKPVDPVDPIDPIEVDGVAVIHAPTFKFGKVKVNPLGDTYPVQEAGFKNPDSSVYYAPDFLQVVDASGSDSLVWRVSVHQEAAFATASAESKLENTRVRLLEQTVSNSNDVTTLKGFNMDETTGYAEIPTTGDITVLESDTNGSTNNTISSLVFKNDYKTAIKNEEQGVNGGVLLSVPAGETPKVDEKYTADFVWTLSVTP